MQFLTAELAQEMVERTMRILDKNINVMNADGVIIGSGERNRIGQKHDGARLVLTSGNSMEIDHEASLRLEGVRPGINLPICFREQVVGVIGITGEPEDIRHHAELVKMAAELVLEQSFLLERIQWRQRIESEIVNQLISDSDVGDHQLKNRAAWLGMDLDKRRMVIVFQPVPSSEDAVHKMMHAIQYDKNADDLLGMTFRHELVLLRQPIPDHRLKHVAGQLQRTMEKAVGGQVLVGIGTVADDISRLPLSFEHARDALRLGKTLDPEESIYFFKSYQLERLFLTAGAVEEEIRWTDFYNPLTQEAELAQTLRIYIEEGGDLQRIVDRLFIHRNTLRYRLDKIQALTGKNPRHVKQLMELYMAQLMSQLS
ncbi:MULTISPECIES: CdaR family transcriptional regulator [Bacillus]|uniref:CdaR family transcriptional regulator n=1 Tax=Bacillus TaxID=1386 RepID=UPI000D056E7B|nr:MULTISPECIES: sugar diacid recognition domain-containing protein [Bacillus]MBR0620235.1 sugar diacid utilization regulator [Bacillus pumilus]MBU5258432.1 helix-turn-helix domain-containing protein [Bacillus pumilus]MCW6698873.1 helix-turn-helix domain-containing protein [Bacillus sp. RP12]PSB69950.1 sugar diacid utilization regulator [Bacillus sp. LNXM12-1]PSB74030.1 sugar diacid utilization regulator [Bacillus sp. LNXM12-2]